MHARRLLCAAVMLCGVATGADFNPSTITAIFAAP